MVMFKCPLLLCILLTSYLKLQVVAGFQSLHHLRIGTSRTSFQRQRPVVRLHDDEDHERYRNYNVDRQRRRSCLFLPSALLLASQKAMAAPPMSEGETDGLGARLERKLRVKPPKVLRNPLNQDFAVLLMRSSYNALDAIDCVAMDQFQRDFFLIRQAEYQWYINELGPGVVQQGYLTDPNYFDFISFAQYATISREINIDPPLVFEEMQPVSVGDDEPQQFVKKVIRRDPSLGGSKDLSLRHSKLVGKAIIDRVDELYGNTEIAIPKIPTSGTVGDNAGAIQASLTQLMKYFLINGFAIDGSVSFNSDQSQFCITLVNPATLWSGKSLQSKGADPLNCFMLKASSELLSRAGLDAKSSSVKYEGNQERTYLTIR